MTRCARGRDFMVNGILDAQHLGQESDTVALDAHHHRGGDRAPDAAIEDASTQRAIPNFVSFAAHPAAPVGFSAKVNSRPQACLSLLTGGHSSTVSSSNGAITLITGYSAFWKRTLGTER